MVETVLDSIGLLANILLLLSRLNSGGLLVETLLLLSLGLGAVLVEEFEGLSGGVAVEDVLELSDRGGDLQAEVEDLLLALKADIFGPLHHAGEVAAGLDVLTDTEVTGTLLDEGVLTDVNITTLDENRRVYYIPWEPSCWHRPSPEGRERARLSFRTWEAIIEKKKRISETCSPSMRHLLLEL